jgi:tetratricopeptide (TPR) repeat protein
LPCTLSSGLIPVKEQVADSIVGVKESAEIAGVEKSNFVRDYANKPGFPKPIVDLASGRLWLRSEVEDFLHAKSSRARPEVSKHGTERLRRKRKMRSQTLAQPLTGSGSIRHSQTAMRLKHQQPANERDFEILCLRLLRQHWNCPTLELYGHKGERQYGIDILDLSGSDVLRAAQCRLHEPWKTIPPAELQEAVGEARRFVPPLQQYLIMTTAKASTVAQNTVLRINREHHQKNLFMVTLMTWEEIEILLDDYHQEVQDLTSRMAEETKTYGSVSIETRVLLDQTIERAANAIDADIEEAKACLARREYQLARLLLQRTRNQKWDVMSARQRFRVLTNIAAAYLAEGKPKEATPLFLEAKTHQPDDQLAIGNEVLAYILANDQGRAFALAADAREKHPHSGPILSYWIRSAPSEIDLGSLQREVPSTLEADPHVCVALAERALTALRFADAEQFAKVAAERNKDWPYTRLLLAEAVVRGELFKTGGIETSSAASLERLHSSAQDLTRIIEQAHNEGAREVEGEALLVRAEAKRLCGQSEAADEDVISAHESLPADPTVLRDYAQLLLKRGERHRAIAELREAVAISRHREDVSALLATTLRTGGDRAERDEALGLLMKLARGKSPQPEGFREQVIWSALEALAEEGQLENSRGFLASIPEDALSRTAFSVFQSKLALLESKREQAFVEADRALGTVEPSTSAEDRRLLGLLLSELGRYKDALPIWQSLASRTILNTDTRRLIDCAARLKRDDVVLEICGALREAGIEDTELVSYEASILQTFDPEGAATVLEHYVTKHPEDRAARLQLAALGLQLHREDLLGVAKDAIPAPSDVPSRNWPLVVRVIAKVSSPESALAYAYKLLRERFAEPDAHRAYLTALLPMEHRPNIPEPKHAGPGSAVSYMENGTNQEQWCVIEEEYEPDGKLNEISPKHPLAGELKGRKLGDKFVLSKGSATERVATIKQILNKYVYRYQDCLLQWQIRFPSVPGIEMVRVTRTEAAAGGEEMDLTSIYSLLDKREASSTELLDIYAKSAVPLQTLGTAFGNNVFDTVCLLALRPGVRIHCCSGAAPERAQAHEAIKIAKAIVVELSSIGTLALTDLLGVLENPPVPIIVSRGTLSELNDLADEEGLTPEPVGMLGKQEGRYIMVEETIEQREARLRQLKQLIAAIKKYCQIATSPSLVALDPEKRAAMIKMLGQHGAESVLLASEPGRVLWTDDLVLATLAQKEFGARRAWTQIYLQTLAETGAIDANVFFEASAKLAAYGYYFTSLNHNILMAARSMAHANPSTWPLKQCLETLEDEAISARDLLGLVTQFIVGIYREGIAGQETVFVSILEHLRRRTDGIPLVKTLHQLLPGMFGVNALAARATEKTMRAWARTLDLTAALKLR